jgi:hypothetical protein
MSISAKVYLIIGVPINAVFKPDDDKNVILAKAKEVGLWLYCAPSIERHFTHIGLKLMFVETSRESLCIATHGAIEEIMKQVREKVAALGVENVEPELVLGVH